MEQAGDETVPHYFFGDAGGGARGARPESGRRPRCGGLLLVPARAQQQVDDAEQGARGERDVEEIPGDPDQDVLAPGVRRALEDFHEVILLQNRQALAADASRTALLT